MTRNVVFFHTAGTQPDSWVGVVNALPADVTPWLPNVSTGDLGSQFADVEKLLDRNELRDVALVAFGTGAPAAVLLAARQPHRVNSLVLASPLLHVDPERTKAMARALKWVPGFLLKRRGMDKKEVLARLEEGPANDPAAALAEVTAPTLLLSTPEKQVSDQVSQTDERMPQATVRVIEDVSGAWYEDDPDRFISEVFQFLDQGR